MKKIEAIIRKSKFDDVKEALHEVEVNFFSYWDVTGVGNEKEGHVYRGITYSTSEIQRRYLSIVVSESLAKKQYKLSFQLLRPIRWEMERYSFYPLKKHIESELEKKKRILLTQTIMETTILTVNNVDDGLYSPIFFMHLGFSFLEIGLTRQKNTINILFKNFFVITMGLLLYCIGGFNLMYPGFEDGEIGLFKFAGFGISAPEGGMEF